MWCHCRWCCRSQFLKTASLVEQSVDRLCRKYALNCWNTCNKRPRNIPCTGFWMMWTVSRISLQTVGNRYLLPAVWSDIWGKVYEKTNRYALDAVTAVNGPVFLQSFVNNNIARIATLAWTNDIQRMSLFRGLPINNVILNYVHITYWRPHKHESLGPVLLTLLRQLYHMRPKC